MMIKSFIFQCHGCSRKIMIGTENFKHYSAFPLVCICEEMFSTPSQKLFWISEKLQNIWFSLPKHGIKIETPATQLERSISTIKVKTIPFRLKHRPEKYYLRFDEDDTPYYDAEVTLIFDQKPPLQVALREYQHGPEPGWQVLPELAYWTRRINYARRKQRGIGGV